MVLPTYQDIMLPLLKIISDEKEHSNHEIHIKLIKYFKLSTSEQAELLPSGLQLTFSNRCGWARFYLKQAGLININTPFLQISKHGKIILESNQKKINNSFLRTIPKFEQYIKKIKKKQK